MGTNTLTTASDGSIIPATDHNSLVTALKDDLVPRDTTTLAATDLAGDLGATTTRWDTSYIKKMVVGTIASLVSIEESAGTMLLKVAGSTVLTLDSGGLVPNTITTDMITDANVTQAKLGSQPSASTSSSGNYANSTTSYTDVTNLSSSITVTGNRAVLIFMSSNTADPGGAHILNTSTASANALINCFVDGGELGAYIIKGNSSGIYAFGSFCWLHTPSAGSRTYTIRARCTATSSTISVTSYNLKLVEL